MFVILLPLSDEPWQVMYLTVKPDGHSFMAKVEIRYLSGPDQWMLSVSDASTGAVYVNQIPLICSYTWLNDLFLPYRHLFNGTGIGSFFVVKAVDIPSTPDPAEHSLHDFNLVWCDRYPPEGV